uniref:Alpha-crystallin B chain n=1 Tax=Aceria tosichella TaxID=561515 RepID=A0A6G1S589_9ACAR
MSSEQREGTPLSNSGSLSGDPFVGLGATAAGPTSGRATTTERRTTTTTTTKRTIKSSDDFMPTATDIQQVRSESRTGSVSSTSTPLFSPVNSQSQQQQQSSATSSQQQQSSTTAANTNQHKNWSSSTTTTTTSAATAASGAENLQSPVIQDTEEGRVLKLRFDVTQYEPDEIVVKTVNNRLTVHAKHEERSENRSVYREYNREFHLPDGTDIEQIKSSLSKEGILTVDCPLPQTQLPGASRRIPIERA